jgi:CMP/dCMP kinase
MNKKLLIAIDGPSASGKGTIARMLGEKLDLPVLYTGNIYRAVAYKLLVNNIDAKDIESIVNIAQNLEVNDLESLKLFTEEVGQLASIISAYKEVRQALHNFQRNFIETSTNGAVIEGRDIGTVICPEADFKFYITAQLEVRAQRRASQYENIDYETILQDLKIRDERDQGRATAPLKPAEDAIIIDSSKLNAEQTLAKILVVVLNSSEA